jgi:hypothetical protein
MAAALLALLYAPWWSVLRRASGRVTTHPPQGIGSEQWRLLFAFFTVSYKQEGWSFGYRPLYGAVFAITLALLAGGTIASHAPARARSRPSGRSAAGDEEGLRAVPLAFGPFRYSLPGNRARRRRRGWDRRLAGPPPCRRRRERCCRRLSSRYALVSYYRNGRYDWSRLVAFLRSRPASEDLPRRPTTPQCTAWRTTSAGPNG